MLFCTMGPASQNERTSTIFFFSFFSFLRFENRLRGVSVPSSGGGACLAFPPLMLQWDLLKGQQKLGMSADLGCLAGQGLSAGVLCQLRVPWVP